MKILTVLTLLMALAMTLLTSSCQRTTPKFSVGVSQCSMDSWREKFIDELRTTALLTDSMKVTVRSANDDDEEQRRQIEQFVAEGVDLLVVSPNQMTSVADAIDAAYDRGIPVILYDRKSVTRQGPMGVKPSRPLPKYHCLWPVCKFRAETSLTMV